MTQYLEFLKELQEEQKSFGLLPQEGCNDEEIQHVASLVNQKLNVELPAEYTEFLKHTDGFADNGIIFFAVDQADPEDQTLPGLVSENLGKYVRFDATEVERPWVALGQSDMCIYAYSPKSSQYHVIDLASGHVMQSFDSFDEMVTMAIKECTCDLLEETEE